MARFTITKEPAPAEVLIPEARHRQRRRYRRSALLISTAALLVGALIAVVVTVTSNGSGTPRGPSRPSALVARRDVVLIRPVLCFAWPYLANQKKTGPVPSCAAPYQLTAAALDVIPDQSTSGYSAKQPIPDPTFEGYRSSARDSPKDTVLIQALRGGPAVAQRFLLGPSEMRLSGVDVTSASAQKDRIGQWVVKVHFSAQGAVAFDRIAHKNFHRFLAIDIGGKVAGIPLIQPTQVSFSSFDGVMEISGALTATNARTVAAAVKA
jgi:hypothetical protein